VEERALLDGKKASRPNPQDTRRGAWQGALHCWPLACCGTMLASKANELAVLIQSERFVRLRVHVKSERSCMHIQEFKSNHYSV
jgi:hypothetical protein